MDVPLATRIRDWLREIVISIRSQYLIHVWHMDIGQGTTISISANSTFTGSVSVVSPSRRLRRPTCVSTVMPGTPKAS